ITRLADSVIVEINERWPEVFGYSAEEVIGRPLLDLNIIDPSVRAAAIDTIHARGRTHLHDSELVIRRKSGELRDVLLSAEILEIGGEAMVLSVTRDITERKQAEAELRLRAQQQEIVAALGQRALTGPPLDALLDEAVRLAAAGLDAEYGALSVLEPDGQAL